MATWKADIKTTQTGSIYTVTVEAGAAYVAQQEIDRLYRPIFTRNLRQVSSCSLCNRILACYFNSCWNLDHLQNRKTL